MSKPNILAPKSHFFPRPRPQTPAPCCTSLCREDYFQRYTPLFGQTIISCIMDVATKLAIYEEWTRSNLKVGQFARKRQISDTVMRRLVKDVKEGKFQQALYRGKMKRIRLSPFLPIEKKVVQYVEYRNVMYRTGHDKCGLSYHILQAKSLQWAKDLLSEYDMSNFRASIKWIHSVLDGYVSTVQSSS